MTRHRRLWGVVVGVALMGLGPSAHAAVARETLDIIRRMPVQHQGRVKPFDSFAWETLQSITGAAQWGRQDPVETVLSMLADPDHWQAEPLIAVPFRPLREALGLGPKTSHVSYNDLVGTRKLMRMLPAIVQKQQREEKLSMLEQETMDAFERFAALSSVFEHKLHVVPPASSTEQVWVTIAETKDYPQERQQAFRSAWTALATAVRDGQSAASISAAQQLVQTLRSANPAAAPPAWRLELEVFYNHAAPFHIARWIYALACLLLGVMVAKTDRRAWQLGMGVLAGACAIHAAGILTRVVLGGRPPVSNFYETMLWLPFVGVVVAMIFEGVYRVGYFGFAASVLAGITLLLADHVPLDSSITPVVAVLRSNLWLTIHVLTIVASYGALALATVLAHVYAGLYLARRGTRDSFESLELFLYRTLQVGVVLLAAGIMLGAVWANASWGRYWGWDPKETWALITLLWFLAVLHGRFAGWITGIGVALSTIGGFFLLLMTYYGVSFYLVGLHSYAGGHAKPLPALLIGYVIAEVTFLAIVGAAALRSKRPA